jgi:hypothetical protein
VDVFFHFLATIPFPIEGSIYTANLSEFMGVLSFTPLETPTFQGGDKP